MYMSNCIYLPTFVFCYTEVNYVFFFNNGSLTALKHFEVGYHKAIKKILGLSYHESNHYACQEGHLLTFEHLLNKIKVNAAFRLFYSSCNFIQKNFSFFNMSSVFFKEIRDLFIDSYDVELVFKQDKSALLSRILYVQNHERQMREGW